MKIKIDTVNKTIELEE